MAETDPLVTPPRRGPRESILARNGGSLYRLIGGGPCVVVEAAALAVLRALVAADGVVLTIRLDRGPPGAFDCARDVGALGSTVSGGHLICWAQVRAMIVMPATLCGNLRQSLCSARATGVFAMLVEMAADPNIAAVVFAAHHDLLSGSIEPGDIATATVTEAYLEGRAKLADFGDVLPRCPFARLLRAAGPASLDD
jgi:hypothetical protein